MVPSRKISIYGEKWFRMVPKQNRRKMNGSGWFRIVPDGSGWFRMVPDGSGWFPMVPDAPALVMP
jgi:hypothetical protein